MAPVKKKKVENRDPDAQSYTKKGGRSVWRWPDNPARGRLQPLEEMDIREAPRPLKSDEQIEQEQGTRAARADTKGKPDMVPFKLHSIRGGQITFSDAFNRYLLGGIPESEEGRRWQLLLMDLQRKSPHLYTLLALRWHDGRSDRAIAEDYGVHHKTVAKMLTGIELRMLAQYRTLYGHDPLDKG